MVFTQVILADQKSKIHGFELGFTTFLLRIKEYIHNYIIIYIYIYILYAYISDKRRYPNSASAVQHVYKYTG